MRSLLFVMLVALIGAPFTSAIAAEGHHGNLTMTTSFELGEDAPPEMAGMDEPMTMLGEVWLAETRMRMDLDTGMGYEAITILDLDANEMYTLDASQKKALRHDLSEYQEMSKTFGGDIMNPSNMFNDWDSYLEMLDQMPGVTYDLLGEKSINGQPCRGVSFAMDMAEMMKNVDTEGVPGGEMMGMMGDYTGEIWFSENVKMMPIQMTAQMDMMGMPMSMVWELKDIEAWTVTDSTFAIPEGYTVEDFEMPFPLEEEAAGEEAADEPAPGEAA